MGRVRETMIVGFFISLFTIQNAVDIIVKMPSPLAVSWNVQSDAGRDAVMVSLCRLKSTAPDLLIQAFGRVMVDTRLRAGVDCFVPDPETESKLFAITRFICDVPSDFEAKNAPFYTFAHPRDVSSLFAFDKSGRGKFVWWQMSRTEFPFEPVEDFRNLNSRFGIRR